MRVAIACPGPSLARCVAIEADVVIGVNRACCFAECDWAAVIDHTVIQQYSGEFLGSPKWLTNQSSFDQLARLDHPWSWSSRKPLTTDWLRKNFFDTRQPDGYTTLPWTLYSFTSALVLAAYLGASDVQIYGADWDGTKDWDGKEPIDHPDRRNAQRWDGERKLYEKVKAWMEDRSITVNRVGLQSDQ